MDYSIYLPTDWEEINPQNDNIDVCIRLADGETFTVVVVTPENLSQMMHREQQDFLTPDFKCLVVHKITYATISQLAEKLVEDRALLQWYGAD